MYSIVEFEEGSTVSYIPTKWIRDGNKSYWPTGMDTLKANLYRQENVSPKKEWRVYPLSRIFCTASKYRINNLLQCHVLQ